MSNRRANWQVLEPAGKSSVIMALENSEAGSFFFALSSHVAQGANSQSVVTLRSNMSRTAWDQMLLRSWASRCLYLVSKMRIHFKPRLYDEAMKTPEFTCACSLAGAQFWCH